MASKEDCALPAGILDIGELARKIQTRIEVVQRENQAKEVVLRALRDTVHEPITVRDRGKPGGGGHNITWTDLDLGTQEEHMISVGKERRATRIKFEGLSRGLKLVQESNALAKIIIKPDSTDHQEVVKLMIRLQNLIDEVNNLEDRKILTELDAQKAEIQLGHEFSRLYEEACSQADPNRGGAESEQELDEALKDEIKTLEKQLHAEQRRGQQMKVLVIKILMSTRIHEFEEDFREKITDMLNFCNKANFYFS
ncbi:uncharacterized protein LOC131877160 [Tigriopus californicus]|uniref:uncharacterized protein LOC131877160 n=1 Tax=Tigriopus californicus TaxID=6832 RepID=UPI0027DAA3B6|nr:uncharacterized protein LOC131877160 [Tigriopus californicus]